MMLLTKPIKTKLAANAAITAGGGDGSDFKPVVKFFGGSACTWLITEMDDDGIMFGLCDLGQGFPELGAVSFDELKAVKFPPFGLPVERDTGFNPDKSLAEYASEARNAGYIKA